MVGEMTKKAQLLDFASELKSSGFKVYAPVNTTTYCHFVKNDKIGYVEAGDWGFNFTTVHKPCRECGTGFSMYRDVIPNVSMADDCLILAPYWASHYNYKAVVKYKNWEDYTSHNNWQAYIEV